MQKARNVKEFVERLDQAKKQNPKDLSSDQDLTIAIMNLISIEEHLMFSGAKTGKESFYALIEEIREMRKQLMLKVIPAYEGEVWCISKHLLATAMRLMEVGTKQQSLGRKSEAYQFFNRAYELYCLFWGLNMNLIDTKQLTWQSDTVSSVTDEADKLLHAASLSTPSAQTLTRADTADTAAAPVMTAATDAAGENTRSASDTLTKLKAFVRKAVDCCIE